MLFVSPNPIDWARDIFVEHRGFSGPVVEISYISSDASGRFDVAKVISRVFPAFRSFVARVNEGFDLTFPSGPYPQDRLYYKGKSMVEYETPAQIEGLGTYRLVKQNGSPISGAAILVGKTPDLVLLSVRLPGDLAKLTPEIVRQVERANAK